MKKLLVTFILLLSYTALGMGFSPGIDLGPAVLPENIHTVVDNCSTGNTPIFQLSNSGYYYHWYILKYDRTEKVYRYVYQSTRRNDDKYKPMTKGKYQCVVENENGDLVTERFQFRDCSDPLPVVKKIELSPCIDDTINLQTDIVADKLEWFVEEGDLELTDTEEFNKEKLQVYSSKIGVGKTLHLRKEATYYVGMNLDKNLVENGDFEDVTVENNHYKGFTSSYDFYGVDVGFPAKVQKAEKDENGNDITSYPGYYHLCTKGMKNRTPDPTKGGTYFLELDGDSNAGGVVYCAKIKAPLEKGQQYQFSYMAISTCEVTAGSRNEYGKIIFKLKYKDEAGIEHTHELLEEKEINHLSWKTYGEGIYWTAPTDCYDAEVILTNSASSYGANDFGVDNIMFQRYYPVETMVVEEYKITPKSCVETLTETKEISIEEAPYIWIGGDGKKYNESGTYEYSYKEKKDNGSWYIVNKILILTIKESEPTPEPAPEPTPEPAPEPGGEPEPTPLPEPEPSPEPEVRPQPLPEYVKLNPMKFFTPNGDGINEKWLVEGLENYPDAEVEIYDRFQRRLLKVKGKDFTGWDGYYNGRPMPTDDYWFLIITYGYNETITGHFLLKN